MILLMPQGSERGTFYFLSVELGPLDFPITYDRPADPTPTP